MTIEEMKLMREWERMLRNLSDFKVIGRANGLRFIVHPNENTSHHRPHFHVEMGGASMVIAIDNGEIIAATGKISKQQISMAQDWWTKNESLIVEYWDEFTNGIVIPLS